MERSFHILLIFLAGILTVISCSDSNFGGGFGGSSSSITQSSSSISSSGIGQSSSSETPPPVTMALPPSGHYIDGLSITVPAETEQGVIHCETSGTAPNENSLIKSGSELNITKTAILQCAYFKNEKLSRTVLRTYIVGRLPDLPIVSIAVDPWDMFKSPTALYKNDYKPNSGCNGSFYSDEEIPIQVDFFEKGTELAWSYPAGIHIHGGCSRMWGKKSVIVSFREAYGQKNLKYPLFPEHPNLTKFKHFMLRNNGNNYPYDYIRDMLMSSLTEGLDIDYQKGRSVLVYYNGEYYGIHNLRERTNGDYFETNYNINEDYIDLVKVEKNRGGPEEVSRGSDADYQDIINWLEGITLTDDNLKRLGQRIDIDNFTNHFQSRIFYRDCDWPGKNMKRWRSNLTRSKWRWLLYDTDHGFGGWGTSYLNSNSVTMMEFITSPTTIGSDPYWPNPPHSTFLLRKLLSNQSYKEAFINRFSLLIATYFTTERINARINKLMSQINSEIYYDEQKWGAKHEEYLPKLMANFATDRPTSAQNELRTFFVLGTPVNLTLSVNGNGRILVHNLPMPKTSVTFNAYPSVPITIKADGTGFKGWSDGENSAERTISVTGTTSLTANF
jgi:hypothetical protein